MPLFILSESPAGYILLKAKDKKLLQREDLTSEISTAEQICSELRLKHFQKFDSAAVALEEASALVESKVTPRLASLLDSIKEEKKASLAVADPKLGTAINKLQLSITPISDTTTTELYRSIREHFASLVPELLPEHINTVSLGLSHSLSRHKLKFSPDKIDTMIVQAVALLDDLDKELNTEAMRVKEWYGWHFPEMAKIVNDNIAYARIILAMGMRSNASKADLAEILPEEIEAAVKAAAEVSMGTEITAEDLEHIQALAQQVVGFTEYRQTLSSYLTARMTALAPNLTTLVGDLVGARLIAHAGSLLNLAKSPASTIQILGAEKALFRALKTKHDTPKYGLIYHASLVGQATGKNKGKIARVLAAKAALGLRADAYAKWGVNGAEDTDVIPEEEKAALGIAARAKVERRLASMEGKPLRARGVGIAPAQQLQPGKWEIKEARKYNPDADGLVGTEPAALASSIAAKSDKATQLETIAHKKALKDESAKKKAAEESDEDEDEDEDERMIDDEAEEDDDDEDDDDVSEEVDVDMADADAKAALQIEAELNGDSSSTAKGTAVSPEFAAVIAASGDKDDDQISLTLSTVSVDSSDSPDSPTSQERNWQSSILGNTKGAKKARKGERHERKLSLSGQRSAERQERNEKIARRMDRKQRRTAKEQQTLRRQGTVVDPDAANALKAGLSLTRYKRKLERGEIRWVDGEPAAVSKKDIKKEKKRAAKEGKKTGGEDATANGELEKKKKKRKREEAEGDDGKVEKKKKKKEKREKERASARA